VDFVTGLPRALAGEPRDPSEAGGR
jgi:hypothetical protein